MFRKPEDTQFARIFDEGGSGDARMEWLRDGLKDLREVPPHGLSNERLRDRLLGTSLAPAKSPSAPWWSWAWAPVAAAALVVVFLPRLRSGEAPTIVMNPPVTVAMGGSSKIDSFVPGTRQGASLAVPNVTTDESVDSIDVAGLLAASVDAADVSIPSPRTRPDRVPRVRSRRPSTATVAKQHATAAPTTPSARDTMASKLATNLNPREELKPDTTANTVATARQASEPSPLIASMMSESNDPLVLLAPEIDAQTGAASATEVTSPANLSVGG